MNILAQTLSYLEGPDPREIHGYLTLKALKSIQTGLDQFWMKWNQLAGPNLFVRTKWHTAHRNVTIEDVV